MTNLDAVELISDMTYTDSKSDVLARIFACEDIVEHDVDEWIKEPAHYWLTQFITHNDVVCGKYIKSRTGYEAEDRDEERRMIMSFFAGKEMPPPSNDDNMRLLEELLSLKDRMDEILKTLITYTKLHDMIRIKIESER